jgi:antitoxin component YwqK of YwqJK toxin-antitoxin module
MFNTKSILVVLNKKNPVVCMFVIFLLLNGCENYTVLETFDSGNVKKECQLKDGIPHGKCIHRFEDGAIESVRSYNNGTLNGLASFFYQNGQLHAKVKYINGVREGLTDYFDSVGVKYQSINFRTNKADGTAYEFFSDGSLKKEINYSLSELNGPSNEYYADGTIRAQLNYSNGKLDGDIVQYFPNGKLELFRVYDNGRLLKSEYYSDSGVLLGRFGEFMIDHEFVDSDSDSDSVSVTITLVNPEFGLLMLDITNPVVAEKTVYGESGIITFGINLPKKGIGTLALEGILYELGTTNNGNSAVIMNKIQFRYDIPYDPTGAHLQ